MNHGRIQGAGSRGPGPPFLAHVVSVLTLGPKLDPLLDPPFFACRPKMDPPGSAPVNTPLTFRITDEVNNTQQNMLFKSFNNIRPQLPDKNGAQNDGHTSEK